MIPRLGLIAQYLQMSEFADNVTPEEQLLRVARLLEPVLYRRMRSVVEYGALSTTTEEVSSE